MRPFDAFGVRLSAFFRKTRSFARFRTDLSAFFSKRARFGKRLFAGEVDGGDAEGERLVADVPEAGGLEAFGHCVTPDEILDAVTEIGICFGIVTDHPAYQRHYFREEEIVQSPYQAIARIGELEYQQLPIAM